MSAPIHPTGTRFSITCEDGIHPAPEGKGNWIRYQDYAALEAQNRQLRKALKSAAPVINCLDVYGRYLPVKYLIADALADTEPKP